MSRKKKYASVIIPAVSLFLLLFLFLLSGLISLGQQLNSVSPILAWLYGLIVLACLGAGIIWPIVSVWRRPIFSMYMLRYRDGRARFYWCRKLADNLKKNTELANEEVAQLEDFLKQGNQADDLLIEFFTEKFSPVIDSEIKSAAKTAFVTTAISQTAFYDMFSMLSVNLHLIRTIVESCGYRPSGASLLGLYVRILKATFLAGGLEEMDLEDTLQTLTFQQKIILWTGFLKNGLDYAEFEWLYNAISKNVVSNRVEWELSLHTAMQNLKYTVQVSPNDFEMHDGHGCRRYFSFNSTSYAERAFLKILFPLNT